jgi:hypothetical protein
MIVWRTLSRQRNALLIHKGNQLLTLTLSRHVPLAALTLTFMARRIKGGELLIVASNVTDQNTLKAYRRWWSIEGLFGYSKTHGLNLEGTRLQH